MSPDYHHFFSNYDTILGNCISVVFIMYFFCSQDNSLPLAFAKKGKTWERNSFCL